MTDEKTQINYHLSCPNFLRHYEELVEQKLKR